MSRTRICTATADDVIIRGRSLPGELMGRLTFTQMVWFQALGAMPTADQTAVLDACLCALMEHGLTPSVQAARATLGGAPESVQGAVAAGLLGVGATFAGSMDACGILLNAIVLGEDPDELVRTRHRVPGFGHPIHRPEDPRAIRLLAIAHEHGVAGPHVAALEQLSDAVDRARGKHVPVNATGAFAAVLLDAGAPAGILRGFALIARCAGLVGHLWEEQQDPASWDMAVAAEKAVPYEP
jgi:citrate synthase